MFRKQNRYNFLPTCATEPMILERHNKDYPNISDISCC